MEEMMLGKIDRRRMIVGTGALIAAAGTAGISFAGSDSIKVSVRNAGRLEGLSGRKLHRALGESLQIYFPGVHGPRKSPARLYAVRLKGREPTKFFEYREMEIKEGQLFFPGNTFFPGSTFFPENMFFSGDAFFSGDTFYPADGRKRAVANAAIRALGESGASDGLFFVAIAGEEIPSVGILLPHEHQ